MSQFFSTIQISIVDYSAEARMKNRPVGNFVGSDFLQQSGIARPPTPRRSPGMNPTWWSWDCGKSISPSNLAVPVKAATSSSCPLLLIPATPRISPDRRLKETSVRAGWTGNRCNGKISNLQGDLLLGHIIFILDDPAHSVQRADRP